MIISTSWIRQIGVMIDSEKWKYQDFGSLSDIVGNINTYFTKPMFAESEFKE
jgi:hypothetical protein